MPEEIVYDQDHLILTSENHGDLIFTHKKLGQFKIPVDKSNLLKNTDHIWDKNGKFSVLINEAVGLGIHAISNGYKAHFTTMNDLVYS